MPPRLAFAFGVLVLMLIVSPLAQEQEDRTLLSTAQMLSITSEASGERALQHVLELVPYQRVRPASEYQTHEVMLDVL